MEEEYRNSYQFCPKCGAVMQNGLCQSCGYGKQFWNAEANGHSSGKKKMSPGSKALLVIVIVLIILIVLFFLLCSYAAVNSVSTIFSVWRTYDDYDDYDYDYDDYYRYDSDYSEYVPDPEDVYYQELANAVEKGLDYQVEWKHETRYPDDEDELSYYSVSYPILRGAEEEKLGRINEQIQKLAGEKLDCYENDGAIVNVITYVTLMQEDRLSVVSRYEVTGEDVEYRLAALNFDMGDGSLIPEKDLLEEDPTLAARFRSQNQIQNGTISFLEELSDEELTEYLMKEETRVLFETPVGTEIGFNYEDGWVTVTFKENSL